MPKKYYAVKVGRTPGVYATWDACKRMVDKYPGAQYKSFTNPQEAQEFVAAGSSPVKTTSVEQKEQPQADEVYAFVDGSFNEATGVYGYGGFLVADGQRYTLQGSGSEPEMAAMRNVAGEVSGSMAAMQKALELQLKRLTIYYDYMGIEMWATGAWKRNKQGTVAYYDYVQEVQKHLELSFVKVKGHSGIEGNEEADRLAKAAVGIAGIC